MKTTSYSNNLLEWGNYYKKPLTFYGFFKRMFCHLEFLSKVILFSGRRSVEIGMGPGAHASFLSWFSPYVVGLEYDKSVLSVARKNTQQFGRGMKLVAADAFNLPFKSGSFNLCFSQGFFEHFSGEEVQKLIREQLRIGDTVIFSVPSNNYPHKDFGNERLLSPQKWQKLIEPINKKGKFGLRVKYCFLDLESLKYSIIRRQRRMPFQVIVIIRHRFGK